MPLTTLDETDRTALEAAAFRRLVAHLAKRTDAQNIELMNLAGFCRNCLANWMQEAARDAGLDVSREDARAYIYGMPYEAWKALHQTEATQTQKDAFKEAFKHHG